MLDTVTMQKVKDHMMSHVAKWPATGADIKAACNNMDELTMDNEMDKEARAMVNAKLTDTETYESPDKVMSVLNMSA